jgi:hypothetical protein
VNKKKILPNAFCPRCHDGFMKEVAKKAAGNPNVYVDISRMVHRCQIPRFTHDNYGNPIVVFIDCGTKKETTIPLREYQKRRREGSI